VSALSPNGYMERVRALAARIGLLKAAKAAPRGGMEPAAAAPPATAAGVSDTARRPSAGVTGAVMVAAVTGGDSIAAPAASDIEKHEAAAGDPKLTEYNGDAAAAAPKWCPEPEPHWCPEPLPEGR
jgi:hypothetical protein